MGGAHENELDRLIRALGEDNVPLGSQQQQQLFVNPPPLREVNNAFLMQQQQGQGGFASFADELLLHPLAVPSPTAQWHNLLLSSSNSSSSDHTAASGGGSGPSSSAASLPSSTGFFLHQLQNELLSDPIADFSSASAAWGFGDNQITPRIGNFGQANYDAIQELLNTPISSTVLPSSRNQQFAAGHHQAPLLGQQQQQLVDDADFYNTRQAASSSSSQQQTMMQQQFHSPSPPPSAVGSLSPVLTSPSPSSMTTTTHGGRRSPSPARLPASAASTLPSTPNSSFSSGSFSDGPEDDASKLPASSSAAAAAAGPSASTSKRKTPDRAMDESEEIQSPELKKPSNKPRKKGLKRVREPRYAIQTRSEVEIMEDGYKWRKYGQKAVKNSPHPRSYYRCTSPKCPVRKRVERSAEDTGLVITTYEGTHNHVNPAVSSRNSSSDAPPALPASGENRPGGAAYQPPPPTSSFPFTSLNSSVLPLRSHYDLTVQIQAGAQTDHISVTSRLSPQAQEVQQQTGASANGVGSGLQSLNIQEPSFLRGHGSLQEFNPSVQELSILRHHQQQQQPQLSGAQNQMQVQNSNEGQMLRSEDNFGAQLGMFGSNTNDLLRGFPIPSFWTTSNNTEPPSSAARGVGGMVAATEDDSVRDQSPVNEGLLGDVVRLGLRW